ncbi:hypothetical protein MAR_010444, partial [Mya arenaria]
MDVTGQTLQATMSSNTDRLENRLRHIRQEMAARERRQREEAERRQMTVLKNLRENHRRGEMLKRRWHQRDRMRRQLIADRDTQRRLQTELKCMSTWNARKAAQSAMISRDQRILEQDDAARADNIAKRDQLTSRQRDLMGS